ncbi:hypothetical protein HN51_003738 [Arachis hypogaea]
MILKACSWLVLMTFMVLGSKKSLCFSQETCILRCGKLSNISHPFRLKGDPKNCGIGMYELECEKNVDKVERPSHMATSFTHSSSYMLISQFFGSPFNRNGWLMLLSLPHREMQVSWEKHKLFLVHNTINIINTNQLHAFEIISASWLIYVEKKGITLIVEKWG